MNVEAMMVEIVKAISMLTENQNRMLSLQEAMEQHLIDDRFEHIKIWEAIKALSPKP